MTVKSLTDATVRNLKPPKLGDRPRQHVYLDNIERGLSLVLVVSYGGTKTFRALTYVNGKARTHKLGTYPQMTVKQARAMAHDYWENPQKFAAQAKVGSFKDVADNWIKRHVDANGLRSARDIKRQLNKYVYPKWKDRSFLEIRRRDVTELLEHIEDHHGRSARNHGRSQADVVLATIRGIMTWQQTRDDDYTSPIVRGMKRDKRKPQDRQRDRILNDDEIRAVWTATDDMMPGFGALLRLCLLTAQRRQKIATMKSADVKDGVWKITVEKREKGTAGTLKLPQIALDLINSQPRIAGNPYVFAGSHRGRRQGPPSFNSFSQHKAELDRMLPKMPPWVLHDLRRTARSLMSQAGVRPDIAERVLGHAIPGVEGVYDRYSYEIEKGEALQRLARLIESILDPSKGENVVQLRGQG
jgi:integrase